MKISTKGRYGLRALVDLALNSCGGPVSLIQVAERQKLSLNYLEQMFSNLRKAGIVKSQKGAKGGYVLAGKPEEIRVGDVLTVLEGPFSVVDDIRPPEERDAIQRAIHELVWAPINEAVNGYLNELTLAELIGQEQSGEQDCEFWAGL